MPDTRIPDSSSEDEPGDQQSSGNHQSMGSEPVVVHGRMRSNVGWDSLVNFLDLSGSVAERNSRQVNV